MSLTKIVKTAMINSNIETMKELADKADITYYKVSGFLNGDERENRVAPSCHVWQVS